MDSRPTHLELFAGAGGGILAGMLLGWRTVCAVENNPYCQRVLVQRQQDGIFEPFPVWDDARTFDGRPWRGRVDIVSAGWPCPPVSCAGKGKGIDDERWLWPEVARIVREIRPGLFFGENVSGILSANDGREFNEVLTDLAESGYDARWTVLSAAKVGAPHLRRRLWILAADADRGGFGQLLQSERQPERGSATDAGCDGEARPLAYSMRPEQRRDERQGEVEADAVPDADERGRDSGKQNIRKGQSHIIGGGENVPDADQQHDDLGGHGAGEIFRRDASGLRKPEIPHSCGQRLSITEQKREHAGPTAQCGWWTVEPGMGRVVDELADRTHRIRAIGNGEVPLCAATAFLLLAGNE